MFIGSDTNSASSQLLVGVIVGSISDWSRMQPCLDVLKELNIPFEANVVSAHRTPEKLKEYGATAEGRICLAIDRANAVGLSSGLCRGECAWERCFASREHAR